MCLLSIFLIRNALHIHGTLRTVKGRKLEQHYCILCHCFYIEFLRIDNLAYVPVVTLQHYLILNRNDFGAVCIKLVLCILVHIVARALAALFLEGSVEEKFFLKPEERAQGKTAPWAFKLKKVTLLGNISDDILTGFCLDITTPMLTQQFRQDLVKVIKKHKGKIPLTLYLFDPGTRYRIQFYSKKFQVAVTSEFIRDLRAIGIDKYEVTRK